MGNKFIINKLKVEDGDWFDCKPINIECLVDESMIESGNGSSIAFNKSSDELSTNVLNIIKRTLDKQNETCKVKIDNTLTRNNNE